MSETDSDALWYVIIDECESHFSTFKLDYPSDYCPYLLAWLGLSGLLFGKS